MNTYTQKMLKSIILKRINIFCLSYLMPLNVFPARLPHSVRNDGAEKAWQSCYIKTPQAFS